MKSQGLSTSEGGAAHALCLYIYMYARPPRVGKHVINQSWSTFERKAWVREGHRGKRHLLAKVRWKIIVTVSTTGRMLYCRTLLSNSVFNPFTVCNQRRETHFSPAGSTCLLLLFLCIQDYQAEPHPTLGPDAWLHILKSCVNMQVYLGYPEASRRWHPSPTQSSSHGPSFTRSVVAVLNWCDSRRDHNSWYKLGRCSVCILPPVGFVTGVKL